jgi:two-component system chemotaxis response regulator CheB
MRHESQVGNLGIVVIGASAGGVEALRAVVAGLPPDLRAAVLVVLHIPRRSSSALPAILRRSGPLPAAHAVHDEELRHGRIYVAPNDRHVLVLDGHVRLTRGPAENGHRPAIDPLFRSAARTFGRRAIGVVLSGSRDDGAAGLASIVARGGTAVVQEPADALYPWMPQAALARVPTEHTAPATKLGPMIAQLTAMDMPDTPVAPDDDGLLNAELAISALGPITTDYLDAPAAGYGCPACGGGLFQIAADPLPRYRCRIGHAWSPDTLLDEQAVALEGALWIALRALEEKSALSRRMATSQSPRHPSAGARFRDMAADADAAGETIRRLIAQVESSATPPKQPADADKPPGEVR